MEKLHLLHLFDGLFTGSKHKLPEAVSYTKALPATCLVWSSRNLNNVHGVTRETMELHGIRRILSINPLHEGVAEASEQTLSQVPSKQLKNTSNDA